MRVLAIVPAAGEGKRMGASTRKPFLSLGGIPILALTLRNLMRCPQIEHFLVCVHPQDQELAEREVLPHLPFPHRVEWVEGGRRRQDTVYNALSREKAEGDLILIHDGVRPFVAPHSVGKAIQETQEWGATVFGLPAVETIKAVNREGIVIKTIERGGLWSIQTPQTFHKDLIVSAYDMAYREGFEGPDDASLVERTGAKVKVLMGSRKNIKITTSEDLALAEGILASWEPAC